MVVPIIVDLLRPRSVVDVGCGAGAWVRAFREHAEAIGVDGDPSADVQADLTTPLDLGRRFDLAVCLEVAEHLPESAAPTLVASLVNLADAVLFSAAIPGQGGPGHINEQWQSWWASRFALHGYGARDVRPLVVDPRVQWWYQQNLVLYQRGAPITVVLDWVHPVAYGRRHGVPSPRQLPAIIRRSLRERFR